MSIATCLKFLTKIDRDEIIKLIEMMGIQENSRIGIGKEETFVGLETARISGKNILRYEKGEQIVKQGDFGISIYKILKGKVEIFRDSRGVKVPLATLEAGSIIGEMLFLSRNAEVRSASARALEETELQVLHPRELKVNYEQVSPVLKEILDQALSRLVRTNRFIDQLAVKKKKHKKKAKEVADYWDSLRLFYRKSVDLECKYVPAGRRKGFSSFLKGRIKDISMSGLSLEVSSDNESVIPHKMGQSFRIDTVLPDGQDLNLTAEIVSIKKESYKTRLGMKFGILPEYSEARKALGFFLLP
jgi:CRP-like cAMP-binding protein